ncbi:MAG: hypothetical protein KF795_31520 [Labilithrix sp.]|nr:hypothetical protein [Labilithrix sp.]
MRLSILACLSCLSLAGTVVACAAEEYPNPPATRDGTEDTEKGGSPSLPAPSSPEKTPGSSTNDDDKTPGDTTPTKPAATSGVDPDKTVGELSANDKKKLCDWQAAVSGGYGKTTKCDDGLSTSTPKSQAACVQRLNLPSCAATIAQVEACITLDAQDPCAFAILSAPECEPLRACAQ